MTWTDVGTVRRYLMGRPIPSQRVYRIPIYLQGSEWGYLPHTRALVFDSVVYGEMGYLPHNIEISLHGTQWSNSIGVYLVRGSIAVVDGARMDTSFTEGVDYVVDYPSGRIRRWNNSNILNGGSVMVWYQPATIYSEETDYEWSAEGNAIRRINGSAMGDPATVYVDYHLAEATAEDSLIAQAIAAAEQMMTDRMSDEITNETSNPLLTEGATLLSAGLVALGLSSRPLHYGRDHAADERSKQWLTLSERLIHEGWSILNPFLKVVGRRGVVKR